MRLQISDIVRKADRIVETCGTRDPYRIARDTGVEIVPCGFRSQRGAYKVINRNRFLFVGEDQDPRMKRTVILHELGHDVLHRAEATKTGGFREFDIFGAAEDRMEYEANVFAAQVGIGDGEFLRMCREGYDMRQIACASDSDVNLVALKADIMISRGYALVRQDRENGFLSYRNADGAVPV